MNRCHGREEQHRGGTSFSFLRSWIAGTALLLAAACFVSACVTSEKKTPETAEPEAIEELGAIRDVVQQVLPLRMLFDVRALQHEKADNPAVMITMTLFPGARSGDTRPQIPREYASVAKMTELARSRCAQMLHAVITQAAIPEDISGIRVLIVHGVETYINQTGQSTGNVAMPVYEVFLPYRKIKGYNKGTLDEARLLNDMREEQNLIPELKFR
jgi:hypothetical protein